MKIPVIDTALCSKCEGCLSVCPMVFRLNPVMDVIEVIDIDHYPDDCVNEAIKICPQDCITWAER